MCSPLLFYIFAFVFIYSPLLFYIFALVFYTFALIILYICLCFLYICFCFYTFALIILYICPSFLKILPYEIYTTLPYQNSDINRHILIRPQNGINSLSLFTRPIPH